MESSWTSLSVKPPGLSAAPRRPRRSPSENIGTRTTDFASASKAISRVSRVSVPGSLLT